jgi:glycosyltransferase involved in cell wall biosynthesis
METHLGRAECDRGIAYLANVFPSPVEPYVGEEIAQMRRSGVAVMACSVLRSTHGTAEAEADLVLFPPNLRSLLMGLWLGFCRRRKLRRLLWQALTETTESWLRRIKTLFQTWLGCCLTWELRNSGVRHLHVHHGYAAAWIAMTAACAMDGTYSMTLHGSDLLLGASFLRAKLDHCESCFTVSEYNRRALLRLYPSVDPRKVVVQYLGVPVPTPASERSNDRGQPSAFRLLTVGRLHPVKNHAFLLHACALLRDRGEAISCRVAGEGPERSRLEKLRAELGLLREVQFLGHVPREQLHAYYNAADVVVLTSRSEGIPLTLMEAMVRGAIVLAPTITGIPELVLDGQTGFLYRPGSLDDFVERIVWIRKTYSALGPIRQGARLQVLRSFNRDLNLPRFQQAFISRIPGLGSLQDAHSVLQ